MSEDNQPIRQVIDQVEQAFKKTDVEDILTALIDAIQTEQALFEGDAVSDEFNQQLKTAIRSRTMRQINAFHLDEPQKAAELVSKLSGSVYEIKRQRSSIRLGAVDFAAKQVKEKNKQYPALYARYWHVAAGAASANIDSRFLDNSIKAEKRKPTTRSFPFPGSDMPKIFMVYAPDLDTGGMEEEELEIIANALANDMDFPVPAFSEITEKAKLRVAKGMESQLRYHKLAQLHKVLPKLFKADPVKAMDIGAKALSSLRYKYIDGAYPLADNNESNRNERALSEWLYECSSKYCDEQRGYLRNASGPSYVTDMAELHLKQLDWTNAALKFPWTCTDWAPICEAAEKIDNSAAYFRNIHNLKLISEDQLSRLTVPLFRSMATAYRIFGNQEAPPAGRKLVSSFSVMSKDGVWPELEKIGPVEYREILDAFMHVRSTDEEYFLCNPGLGQVDDMMKQVCDYFITADSDEFFRYMMRSALEATDRAAQNKRYDHVAGYRQFILIKLLTDSDFAQSGKEICREEILNYQRNPGYLSQDAQGFCDDLMGLNKANQDPHPTIN